MINPEDIRIDRGSSISDEQAQLLQKHAYGECLEIGSWLGFSTIILAEKCQKVVSVDPHTNPPHARAFVTLYAFLDNLELFKVQNKVIPIVGFSNDVLPLLHPHQFDFIFIDGDHSYEQVLQDTASSIWLVKQGGLIAWHDYTYPDVQQAVDKYMKDQKFIAQEGSLVIYEIS